MTLAGASLPIINHLIQADKDIRYAVRGKHYNDNSGGNDVDIRKRITTMWDWGKTAQKVHDINPQCKVLICYIFPSATFNNEYMWNSRSDKKNITRGTA